MKRATRRGSTLIEVLVGCGVFVFLMLSSIAIMDIGTGGYKAVEAKADVTRQLNRFESDITQELKRASQSSIAVYTPSNDYHWALWFKTPMNSPAAVDSDFKPTVPMGDSLLTIIDNDGKPVMQRYVLYYVTRMDSDQHQQKYGYLCSSYGSSNGPDTTCPHKWLVKKELYLYDHQTSGNDTIGAQGDSAAIGRVHTLMSDTTVTQAGLLAESESNDPTSVVHRVQILAENVISFEVTRLAVNPSVPTDSPTVSPTGPIVLFDIKTFKALGADRNHLGATSEATVSTKSVGGLNMVDASPTADNQGNVTVHTNTTITPSFGGFTIQLDNRVIPQNP
jgi:hypothetical protein